MPDVRLVKPAVGVPQNIVCEPQSRFIFDFPMDAATLSRVDDHLVLTFDDGSTIRLENFYTAYAFVFRGRRGNFWSGFLHGHERA